MPRTAFVWDDALASYRFHEDHPLNPRRLELTLGLIRRLGLVGDKDRPVIQPRVATESEVLTVHDAAYVAAVKRAGKGQAGRDPGYGLGTADVPVVPGMHDASLRIAGATLTAAEEVMSGRARRAFNMSGGLHHADRARAAGFCVYNDLAIAIRWLQRQHGARVLYLDIDAHHGDGVQAIFYEDPEVLTVSLHESGAFLYPGTGFVDETGRGAGAGSAANVPLDAHTEDASFATAFDRVVPRLARAFRPDVIVLQCGCDAHVLDPLTHLRCTTGLYERLVRATCALADELCAGRVVATGGGGYAIHTVVPRAWTLVWAALCGETLPDALPEDWLRALRIEAGSEVPTTLRDAPDAFAVAPRRATVEDANTRTVDALLRRLLPDLPRPGAGTVMATDRAGDPFEIRPYTTADRVPLTQMYETLEPKRGAQGLPPAHAPGVRRWLDRVLAHGIHFVAVNGSRVIGHVMLIPMEDGAFELANFVHQSRRDRGIGTRLNRTAVAAAREHSVPRVWLCVEPSNRAALKSYERAGFRILPGSEWAPEIEMAVDFSYDEGASGSGA